MQPQQFQPENIGALDALDAAPPRPSAYYMGPRKVIRYLSGYLNHCTITLQPRNWWSAKELLRLYSPEQAEAEDTSKRVLDALWQCTFDMYQVDALDVDSAQSAKTDWRI